MLTALLLATCAASLSSDASNDTPYRARLLAQADLPAVTVDRGELGVERSRLILARPGLGFPIAMMTLGGVGTFLFSGVLASGPYDTGTSVVIGVLLTGGIATLVLGVVSLIRRVGHRNETDARLKVIEQTIGPAGSDENLAPPPGPPPPPPGPDQGPPGPPPPPPPPLAMIPIGSFQVTAGGG